MRRVFLLFVFLFPLLGWGAFVANQGVQSGGGGSWSQVIDSGGTTTNNLGNISANTYIMGQFQASTTGTVTSVDVYMNKANSPTGNFYVEIWSDDGGAPAFPNVLLTNGQSNAVGGASLPSTAANQNFPYGTGPSLTSGTWYWVGVHAGTIDGSNYAKMYREGVGTYRVAKGDATPAWTTLDSTSDIRITINGN